VFDHSERTRFDLGPAHRKLKCEQCHTKALGEVKPNRTCEQCHAKDNKHGDRFKAFGSPPRCETCHPSGGPKWTPNNFNHATHTKFKLEFKHAEVTCRACHRGASPSEFERFAFNPNKDCKSCHAHAKVHSDDNPRLSQRFAIRSIPTLLRLDRGREAARQAGAVGAAQIVAFARG